MKNNKRDTNRSKSMKQLLFCCLLSLGVSSVVIFYSYFSNKSNITALRDQSNASAQSATSSLTVDFNTTVNPFNDSMRGVGLVNWEHAWGKPFPNKVPGLSSALSAIRPGLIRYAGGLWANSVGFDRTSQRAPYTSWQSNGQTYYFHYGLDEVDDLGLFANSVNADVMIQGNISNNDPAMWADMVKYTRKEKNYRFTSWEFGNELDYDADHKMTGTEYAARIPGYINAIKAIDPTVGIRGAAVAYGVVQDDSNPALSDFLTKPVPAAHSTGKDLDGLSWHWY